MAGDWIKVRTTLPQDGRLRIVAKKCHASSVTAFGALVTLWCFVDAHATPEGELVGYAANDINELVGLPGFAEALPGDWIDISGEWVKIPEYQEHNGTTAKVRAQATKRKRAERSVTPESRNYRDKNVTREEKREIVKEGSEKSLPISLPDWLPAEVWADWHAYRNTRKGWTHKAKELSLATLTQLHDQGFNPKHIIEKSIERGWTGLFAPNTPVGSQQSFSGPQKTRKELGV